MNVLITALGYSLTPENETDLELAQIHLDQGDNVVLSYCQADMLACDLNPSHDLIMCKTCISRRFAGLPLLSQRISTRSFLDLSKETRAELETLRTQFDTLEALKQYRIGNFDIGYAVASSIISDDRDPKPDLAEKTGLIRDFIVSAFTVYRSVQRYLDEHPTDCVYVVNGRLAPVRAAFRACQSRNVDCYIWDFGHDLQHYDLCRNGLPHELDLIYQRIIQQWQTTPDTHRRENLAKEFYIDRTHGVIPNWYSYLTRQKEGVLPENFDSQKHNIVIFSSSEDEFEGIDEDWDKTLYSDQLEGVRLIADSFASEPAFHFFLRLHPNLRRVHNLYTNQLRALTRPNLTVIQPDDAISTYALMGAAEKVLTFGSTMGVEAAYWGKPSILAGRAWYEKLGSTYNPSSHAELIEWLKTDLPPKSKEGALKYGYFMQTYGEPYKYYRGTSPHTGAFKDTVVRARWPLEYLVNIHRGYKLRQILSWPFVLATRKRVWGRLR